MTEANYESFPIDGQSTVVSAQPPSQTAAVPLMLTLWAAYSDVEIKRMVPDGAHPLAGYSASMIAAHIKSWLIEKYFSGRCAH
jgi:hypothetical protein